MKSVRLNKEDMISLLVDWTFSLYENNPPENIYEDNLQYVEDFVNGYFEGRGDLERSKKWKMITQ